MSKEFKFTIAAIFASAGVIFYLMLAPTSNTISASDEARARAQLQPIPAQAK